MKLQDLSFSVHKLGRVYTGTGKISQKGKMRVAKLRVGILLGRLVVARVSLCVLA